MDRDEMRSKTLQVLQRFASLKHPTLKGLVIGCGGHYSLASSQEFDALIDELATAGVISRDQPFGWIRAVLPQPGKPSQASGRSKTHARPRSGSGAIGG
jgi:hypothetical protein